MAIGLTITGQQLISLLVGRFGLMRLPRTQQRVRLVGALFLLEVTLIQAF